MLMRNKLYMILYTWDIKYCKMLIKSLSNNHVHTYVYLFIVVRLLNRQTISKGTASVPLPRLTPVERCRDLSLWSTDRKQIVHTPIIYTAIVFRQAMPRLMSPCVPMRVLHKGARGCASRESDTRMYIRDAPVWIFEVTT